MGEYLDDDELAFFMDMAMNESQRWLEVIRSFLLLKFQKQKKKIFDKIESLSFTFISHTIFFFAGNLSRTFH